MPKKKIYLDYAATTPIDKKVFEAMRPYFSAKFGNPMSIHSFGQEAAEAIDNARQQITAFLNCSASEIIFTSGATESNNLVIKGMLKHYYSVSRKKGAKPHIITSQFEHPCVLNACRSAEKENLAEITYLPVNKDGVIKTDDVKKAIKKNTLLISIMYVNNEIGTVQPIAEIGKIIKSINQKLVFHTDAAQAANYFNCDVNKLNVDLLSLSGHKIYGPKGVGVLYIRKNTPIKHIRDGGEQEYGMRPGTHNVPGIVGLGEAIASIKRQAASIERIKKLKDYLIEKVLGEIPKSYLNGSAAKRSPNNANFRFDGAEGEGLALALDLEGVAVSTGSACASKSIKPSQTLLALGLKPEQIHGSLRFTLGKQTTKKELDYTIEKLKEAVERLRKISGSVTGNQ